ncbi:MAG: hypothetical protein NZ761_06245 [Dehalococcoidia bacterium]|nr:hypothetical protein [Dehalococcoidia bacterium]
MERDEPAYEAFNRYAERALALATVRSAEGDDPLGTFKRVADDLRAVLATVPPDDAWPSAWRALLASTESIVADLGIRSLLFAVQLSRSSGSCQRGAVASPMRRAKRLLGRGVDGAWARLWNAAAEWAEHVIGADPTLALTLASLRAAREHALSGCDTACPVIAGAFPSLLALYYHWGIARASAGE